MLKFIRLLVEGLDELKAINYNLHHIRTEIRDELHTISGQLTEMQANDQFGFPAKLVRRRAVQRPRSISMRW
jgi:hypothetical protein